MHYQVSLNQNITKELSEFEAMQDPVEIFAYATEDHKASETIEKSYFGRYSSISPPRDNDAQNKLRAGSMQKDKPKDRDVSPCTPIEILDKVLQKRCNFKPQIALSKANFATAGQIERRKSVSPFRSISPISTTQMQNVKNVFGGFCSKFNTIQKITPKSYTATRVQAQLKYIQTLRKSTFQAQFVKKILFSAWKATLKKKRDMSC